MRTQRSPVELGFDRYDKVRLQHALKQVRDKRTYLRLKAIQLFSEGMDIHAVAKFTNKTVRIIYQWIRTYLKKHQACALFDGPRSGRPRAAPTVTEKRILRELKHNPLKLGYNTTVWTVALLAKHLSNRYGCNISARTLRRRMKQIGLRCKRPRYVYSEKHPHRAQKKGLLSES
jgi:transposase